eukprot:356443-Chlamydomonas_euryale.AAC.9
MRQPPKTAAVDAAAYANEELDTQLCKVWDGWGCKHCTLQVRLLAVRQRFGGASEVEVMAVALMLACGGEMIGLCCLCACPLLGSIAGVHTTSRQHIAYVNYVCFQCMGSTASAPRSSTSRRGP